MEFQGTKGEWEVIGQRPLCEYVIGRENYTVAFTSIIEGASEGEKEVAEANAQLIAAAPELLEALQELEEHCRLSIGMHGDGLRKARKAINKALNQ